ncbi:galactose mutarotase-like domain-containing protein [Staphylotrichum tortipilum]|uniref:Glucose-6-phosphate 1-epimerase n=1 Tax=Staphylotrichum tortipilum TaxID=2831512 RepID=A0AAN6MPK8_9PEZI|nr:galactose mutarotase-like domain-containing protein [Staphylotrichum longicolle]
MVERANKPKPPALSATPGLPPQPTVVFSEDNSRVTAELPTGESVTVLLYGATVISWKDAAGDEKLWLSEAAKLDGSKAVRGGIPIVFPVFGTAPTHPQTKSLPQHGFARTSRWEFLGKSTSESMAGPAANEPTVKLDFGLSSAAPGLDPLATTNWPFRFNLIYSVTLKRDSLTTSIVATNDDAQPFDCQVLLHTYLRVKDITTVEITGLADATYIDKVDNATTKTSTTPTTTITSETDRVYTPASPSSPVTVSTSGTPLYHVTRDNLANVVIWNPWTAKAAAMADFEPKEGFRNMLCVEPGAVAGWQSVEAGDAFEGAQTIALAN